MSRLRLWLVMAVLGALLVAMAGLAAFDHVLLAGLAALVFTAIYCLVLDRGRPGVR